MNFINRQPGVAAAVAFIAGLLIGWMVLGWGLFPVEYIDGAPSDMRQDDLDNYLRTTAELYSLDNNDAEKVRQRLLNAWPPEEAALYICQAATDPSRVSDPAEAQRFEALAIIANGRSCADTLASPGAADASGGPDIVPILTLAFILLVFLLAILLVLRRRNALMYEAESYGMGTALPEAPPTTSDGDDDVATIPLARFQSSYTIGRDNYDDSFSIENRNGDFLGECGVGISESIGANLPKNVTAFEVWLFDKNDIRTVTKVIMSDHAFFDDALKAKLAPKGEPVLAREGEVVVLETATLIVNAEIKSMQYGTGTLPPQSFFDNFTIELSAWAKDGDMPEADVQGRVDELLDY